MRDKTPSFVAVAVATLGFAWAAQAQGPAGKVDVCHKGDVISVAPEAVQAHVAHGDSIGGCTPDRVYVSTDPEVCLVIRWTCPAGTLSFSDETGCGCESQ